MMIPLALSSRGSLVAQAQIGIAPLHSADARTAKICKVELMNPFVERLTKKHAINPLTLPFEFLSGMPT